MLFWDIWRVQTSVLLNFYGPVICQNRPNVGNIIPINYGPIVSHFATHAMWLVCIDILKIVNWKCTVSGIIHNYSSLSSGSRYCKPEVISWWKVSITVFYTRFLCQTDQKCAESSVFWQFFYYCPPSKQRERSLKCDAKNSTNIY